MALDKEYFDAIHIEVVKKKYYNANKVEAVFADIRQQAAALMEENARLREQLQEKSNRPDDLGETLFSAQLIYRRIVEKAQQRADDILADARKDSELLRRAALDQQDNAVQRVAACLERVRKLQQNAIDEINADWQTFLCGLYPEEQAAAAVDVFTPLWQSREAEDETPADLREKVDAIAKQLQAIGAED